MNITRNFFLNSTSIGSNLLLLLYSPFLVKYINGVDYFQVTQLYVYKKDLFSSRDKNFTSYVNKSCSFRFFKKETSVLMNKEKVFFF